MNVPGCGGIANACTLDRALTEVTAVKNVIKLDTPAPTIYLTNGLTVATDVTIDARNAVIQRSTAGATLTISAGRTATIFGGTIGDPTGGRHDGEDITCNSGATLTVNGTNIFNMDKLAINAVGTSVTLLRSSLFANKGGGISVTSGTFVIVGNIFSANGDASSPTGGVLINTSSDPVNRIEFNTIEGNHASIGGNAPGVHCIAGSDLIARNNIIWNNNNNTGAQVGGTCKHAYSDIGVMSVGAANDGGNNLNVDPQFISFLNPHLQPGSLVIKEADPAAKLDAAAAKDLDGDLRIAPADIGADQVPRP